MGYKQSRKIVRFGATSRGVVLPKGWLEFYQLEHGDTVTLLGDSVLIIATREVAAKAKEILEWLEKERVGRPES